MARLIVKAKGHTIDVQGKQAKAVYAAAQTEWQRLFSQPMTDDLKEAIHACHFASHVFGFEGFYDGPDGVLIGWGL